VEIEDSLIEPGDARIGIFCKNEKCQYHKIPLIGIERKDSKVFISDVLI